MRVGNFSVRIPEGVERESGYVELNHGTVYTLLLQNHWNNRRCDAEVTIDGKLLGAFRINVYGQIILERSPHDQGRFTFFKADSPEGQAAQASSIAEDLHGLIQVRFKPERELCQSKAVLTSGITPLSGHLSAFPEGEEKTCGSFGNRSLSPGVTGLTGHSDQTFYDVPCLDYDPAEEVLISIRLVAGGGVRPLTTPPRANPVPKAIP